MIGRMLYQRFLKLGRDEEGAALVVTLAVFFFMYLMIAGVYAVGTAVKERVQLQNACDAAAYSAAVVQADTLSRIATLNRAMSWTYVSMTRRQMDYIVYKWLDHTLKHFEHDKARAMAWAAAGSPCAAHVNDYGWNGIWLNANGSSGGATVTETDISTALSDFCRDNLDGESFYASGNSSGIDKLADQIVEDKKTIRGLNTCVAKLANELNQNVRNAVSDVLVANLSAEDRSSCRYVAIQSNEPLTEYFRYLNNTESDETLFLSFSGNGTPTGTFNNGTDVWFVRDNERKQDGGNGILRSYNHADRGKLYSEWEWHSTKWRCGSKRGVSPWHIPHPLSACGHNHLYDNCIASATMKKVVYEYWEREWVQIEKPRRRLRVRGRIKVDDDGNWWRQTWVKKTVTVEVPDGLTTVTMKAKCYGDNDQIYDTDYYVGERAKPIVLTPSYFGKAGTITVGLARQNENPWLRLLGRAGTALGIYSAFNPFCQWSWAFASAKAGYKRLGDETYGQDEDDNWYPNRAYRIDWDDNQSWNLCQSDWDAVMVPVRCAESDALDGAWKIGNTQMLDDYVIADQDKWRWLTQDDDRKEVVLDDWGNMIAGGTDNVPEIGMLGPDDDPWEWVNSIPNASDNSGHVSAEWQIGNPGVGLHWSHLAERMFH